MNCKTSFLMKCATSLFLCAVLWQPVTPVAAAEPVLNYPVRPIRVVVPASAGGSGDLAIRMIAPRLLERLGQPLVVENRAGAGSVIGTDFVAKAAPDGYTLLVTVSSFTIIPSTYKKLPFDPIKDFAPVTTLNSFSFIVVVHPSVPANSVKELIALAKAKPGVLNYASGGTGTPPHMGAELFKSMAGINIVHVPFKGADAIPALLDGQVQSYVGPFGTMLPYVKAGRLRALAITSTKRALLLPDLPTVAEAGLPGFEHSAWSGMLAPASTPPAVVRKLASEVTAAVKLPAISERFAAEGVEPGGISSGEFAVLLEKEIAKWGKVAREAGIQPE